MRLKLLMAAILYSITLYDAEGQESKNSISLNVGFGGIARQDLIFSPNIHRDISAINFGLEYSRGGKFYQNGSVRFASFSPIQVSPYEYTLNGEKKLSGSHLFSLIDIDYNFGKEILKREKSTTTIGLLFTTDIQMLNYVYGRIGSFGYYSIFGLGPFVNRDYQLNEKHYLSAYAGFPILSWLSRSPYLVNDDEFIENISSHSDVDSFFAFIGDGNLRTLNKLQVFDLRARYLYKINNRWDLGLGYIFEFLRVEDPRNLISFRNSMNFSTRYKF